MVTQFSHGQGWVLSGPGEYSPQTVITAGVTMIWYIYHYIFEDLDHHSWRIYGPEVYDLDIYDMSTAKYLAGTPRGSRGGDSPLFTLDEQEVWCLGGMSRPRGWKIIKDTKSDVVRLERLKEADSISDRFPSHGYTVTDDGWILNPRKTRLIWLPHHWRNYELGCSHGGRFIALLDYRLPEPVILEPRE